VVLEAQACGKPVVTTDATGAVDSVIDQETGLIVPVGDADRLADTLLKVARDPDRAAVMGMAGRARVQKDFDQRNTWKNLIEHYEGVMRATTRQRGMGAVAKWCFDRIFGFLLLVVLSPVLCVTALAVILLLGWPIIFRQERLGRRGRPIFVHKFRTMTQARDAAGQLLPDEQRLTRLGRVMRSLSLDELPQLWDVVLGRMSLVGPRPLLAIYKDRYTPEQFRRHNVFPGITGWAQVHGRNAISWEQKFELDVWYVQHWSFWLDLKILAMTLWRTLRREGISSPTDATMPEFMPSSKAKGAE
jgi:lipopolysaccharide/colanic/teichoic acid biosynthesis glycosyltransferase